MSTPKILSSLGLLVLVALLLFVSAARGAEPYDVQVTSVDFEPGHAVNIIVSGYTNMSFSLRITTSDGDIVSGRDAQLNLTGGYIYSWTPSSDGEYNVTVVYATGFTITKRFLIQQKVTEVDIAQIYVTLFGIRDRLLLSLAATMGMAQIGVGLGGVAVLVSVVTLLYIRKNVSRMETEVERWMKNYMRGRLEALNEENLKLKQALKVKPSDVATGKP